jgi:hypothetical protein
MLTNSIPEYLAMLKTFIEFGCTGIISNSKFNFFGNLKNKNLRPYAIASGLFVGKLLSIYKIKFNDLSVVFLAEHFPKDCRSKDLELLDRLKQHASIEYNKTYRALFGMDIEDIREIIANLPMI